MIVVMRAGADREQVDAVMDFVRDMGLRPQPIFGAERTIIGVVGAMDEDKAQLIEQLGNLDSVDRAMPISRPYKFASREWRSGKTIIDVGGVKIGGPNIVVMAGPCTVESREQLLTTAHAVKEAGATILRGGAFKPSTSPYSFHGLGIEGLKLLAEAREATGLPVITELLDPDHLAAVEEYADIIQIGTRNMANFALLRKVGHSKLPVMLKRGMASTIDEWLQAAEYILSEGNSNVILCERGIRTFEPSTRNTFDINGMAVALERSHLPVVADPSQGTGHRSLVPPVSRAAIAAGADAVIIEVHPDPARARKDGAQSVTIPEFQKLMGEIRVLAEVMHRPLVG
jgi:3-deoxy-7-phosphoheptulonate synthase